MKPKNSLYSRAKLSALSAANHAPDNPTKTWFQRSCLGYQQGENAYQAFGWNSEDSCDRFGEVCRYRTTSRRGVVFCVKRLVFGQNGHVTAFMHCVNFQPCNWITSSVLLHHLNNDNIPVEINFALIFVRLILAIAITRSMVVLERLKYYHSNRLLPLRPLHSSEIFYLLWMSRCIGFKNAPHNSYLNLTWQIQKSPDDTGITCRGGVGGHVRWLMEWCDLWNKGDTKGHYESYWNLISSAFYL